MRRRVLLTTGDLFYSDEAPLYSIEYAPVGVSGVYGWWAEIPGWVDIENKTDGFGETERTWSVDGKVIAHQKGDVCSVRLHMSIRFEFPGQHPLSHCWLCETGEQREYGIASQSKATDAMPHEMAKFLYHRIPGNVADMRVTLLELRTFEHVMQRESPTRRKYLDHLSELQDLLPGRDFRV